MANVKFYKVASPRAKRYDSSGGLLPITFTDIGGDWGVFATDNIGLITQLDSMIARNEQAIWSITQEEYHDLKKNRTSPTAWREELGKTGLERNKAPVRAALGPLDNPANPYEGKAGLVAGGSPASVSAPPAPEAPVRPTASKRK